MSRYSALLVEDDPALGFKTKYFLEQHEYEVTHCTDTRSAWNRFMKGNFDICIGELMQPKQNGLELITHIRQKNSVVPIIILSSKYNDPDRISGMECGADCFMPKPYNLEELLLRMRIFLRIKNKKSAIKQARIPIGEYVFDFDEMNLTIPDKNHKITLTQRECSLLQYLCNHTGTLIKKEDVLMEIWGKNDHSLSRSLDVFISKIRKLFRNQPEIELKTVHGIGYKFNYTAKQAVLVSR